MKKLLILFLLVAFRFSLSAQVIKYWPLYPTINDSVTIVYDATKGGGQLAGLDSVLVHTGVLSAQSASTSDWWDINELWFTPIDTLQEPKNLKISFCKDLGNNKYQFGMNIKQFYNVNSSENIRELCLVYRNVKGTLTGKNGDSDIYIHVYKTGFCARFIAPMQIPLTPTINQNVQFSVASNQKALIQIYRQNVLVATSSGLDTVFKWNYTPTQTGKFWVKCVAKNAQDSVSVDSVYYIVQAPALVQNSPAGTRDGINYIDSTTVILQFYAPNKTNAYVIGDFNSQYETINKKDTLITNPYDWQLNPDYQMNKSTDGNRYWIKLTNLMPRYQYSFQYWVDPSLSSSVKIADPYAELVLDGSNDPSIPSIIYPNLKKYPYGKTAEICSVLQTAQVPYKWKVPDFSRPDNRDIVAYELLIRDFSLRKSYQFVMDSIQYLKRLGINTLELMPVTQFDGNDSWGYMPEFNFAPAKIYGPEDNLKMLIDVAHKNGIAVVLDVVMNHNSGESPFARLYFDIDKNLTDPANPWFNVQIPHPDGEYYDFNHEASVTQNLLDSVLSFWVDKYNIDGYRLDLSKGYTNYNSIDQANAIEVWGEYDASRVAILERMANVFWAKHPGRWLILEHFADNDEESVLANYGFMLWGNESYNYEQAAMGWVGTYCDGTFGDCGDDFSGISYLTPGGWNFHNLYGYAESHDEQRIMYQCEAYGNSSGSYTTRNITNALDRMAEAYAFLIPVPGPKMFWMFGELGYDYSIFWPGQDGNTLTRVMDKPVRWDYEKQPNRYLLYQKVAALAKLKVSDQLFRTSNFETYTHNPDKRFRLWPDGYVSTTMSCVIVGNFDVKTGPVWPEFTTPGTWYDYFSGDSLQISSTQTAGQGFTITLNPGDFRIFTTKKYPKLNLPDSASELTSVQNLNKQVNNSSNFFAAPNPFSESTVITYSLFKDDNVSIDIYNLIGEHVKTLFNAHQIAGTYHVTWDGTDNSGMKVRDGCYIYSVTTSNKVYRSQIAFVR